MHQLLRVWITVTALFSLLPAEVIFETGSLREFIGGEAPQLAYDNYISHVAEGIVSPGYNDYGPDWLDVQTDGFGNYRIIDSDDQTLNHWRAIFTHLIRGDIQRADLLLSDSLPTFHYDLVEFTDTNTERVYYMLREQLDYSFNDANLPEVLNDDVSGSFANGWGLYIFNPTAARQQVVVEVPHPCDDFIAPYVGTELFLQIDAIGFAMAGAGREVRWTQSGTYSNNKSLSDPARNANSVFQIFHEVLSDSLMETGPHAPLILHTHSFDDNDAHEGFQDIVLSGGWDAWNANKPIRDISDEHLDFVNFTAEIPIPANTFGSHAEVLVNEYYRVHYDDVFNYYGENNIYPIPHTYTLLGPNTGVQMNYLRQFFNNNEVYEPWVQVEMMEKPQLFQDMDMPLTELYAGDYPTSYHNFQIMLDYFQPFIDAVQAYLVNWETVPDVTAPDRITNLQTTLDGHHYVSLQWDPVYDTNHETYRIYYDENAIDEFSPWWDADNDSRMHDMRTSETSILYLDPQLEYVFSIEARDHFGNVGVMSEPASEEVPGHESHTIIENFDDGEVELGSWQSQDEDPSGWSINDVRTFMGSPYSLKLFGNTWKSEPIEPVTLQENSVWQVSTYITYSGEIQGIGFADSINHVYYSLHGSEQVDIDEWVTVYQGFFENNRWNTIALPLADDWYARIDYYPTITNVIYINDRDDDATATIYFDEILDVTSLIEISPQVDIDYDLGPVYSTLAGIRSVDVDFTSQVIDIDSDAHEYLWSFGDGTTSNDAHPTHTFNVEDDHEYTVLLQVVDEAGYWGNATTEVSVDPGESSFPLTLNFVGDIMLARRYEEEGGIIPTQGVEAIFDPTLSALGNAADVSVANLECALTDGGEEHPTKSVVYRGSPENSAGLTYAGIDIVSLANNHTLDYDLFGLQSTQNVLDNEGILYSGSGANSYEAYLPLFHNAKGVNIAYLANCDRTGQYNNAQPYLNAGMDKPGFAYLTPYYLQQQIAEVQDLADLIIMEMHAGSEYSSEPGADYDLGQWGVGLDPVDWIAPREIVKHMDLEDISDEDENYSPESDVPHVWDREIRHLAIDSGADLVVVHHPHIIQGFEVYNGKLIAHSLGNFVFDLNYHETFPSVILNAEVDESGFYRFSPTPVYIDDYIPVVAQGELGLHILDYLAQRSRELDTYLAVDRENGTADIILDTLSMPVLEISARQPVDFQQSGSYWVTEPVAVHDIGNIGSLVDIQTAGNWEYRLGRELLWYGNMEAEGSTEWNLNSADEWLDETDPYRGERAITHRRAAGAGDNIITNLENRIRVDADKDHSFQGMIKTQNGNNVTIQIRYYPSRTSSTSLGTDDITSGIDGISDWTYYQSGTNPPSSAEYFDLRLNSDVPATGEARSWFDDVSVVEWGEWTDLNAANQIMTPNDIYYIQLRNNQPVTTAPVEFLVNVYTDAPPVEVAFSSDQTLGLIPLEINFSDDSEGLVAWWEWDFGDGSTSTEQHPAHTYTEPGIYDVSLTIRDYAGNPLTITQTDLVRVFSEYLPGDLNFDANTTIADVVLLVNIILGHISPDDAQIAAGDLNQDGQLSVQDLVFLVNLILYG